MIRKLLFIPFIILPCFTSYSQGTCDSLTMLKKTVYGFKPSGLSETQQQTKSNELDVFWKTAENHPKEAASCLQNLIEKETKDSFFCFDASSLLLSLDTTGKYVPAVINGLNKCNLEDLDLEAFLKICFFLSYKKQDISDLAIKLISIPNAKVFLSRHFITLTGADASIFLFNSLPTPKAEELFTSTIKKGNPTAKENAALLLTLLATDNGDRFLDSSMKNGLLPDSVSKRIQKIKQSSIITGSGSISRDEILKDLSYGPINFEKEFFGFAGKEDLMQSACKVLTKKDIPIIREARQKSTPGLSDEALDEYFALTNILMTVRAKNE